MRANVCLMLVLALMMGCDKKSEDSKSSSTDTAAKTPNMGLSLEAIVTAQPDIEKHWELSMKVDFTNKQFTETRKEFARGYRTVYTTPLYGLTATNVTRDDWKHEGRDFICEVVPDPLSAEDTLNGITWKGSVWIHPGFQRNSFQGGPWGDWQKFDQMSGMQFT